MPYDLTETITRTAPESTIVRLKPNAAVIIYPAGQQSGQVWSGAADEYGNLKVPALATGHYDIYVDGALQSSIHHVHSGNVLTPARPWTFHVSGTLADLDESPNVAQFYAHVAGKITQITVNIQHVNATGDVTIHLLKGAANRGSAMTVAANSIWSVQCHPQSELYGWNDPKTVDLSVAAGQNITIGVEHTADTVEGLTVIVHFVPTVS